MNRLHEMAARIRRGEPIPWPLAALLSAATPIFRLGMRRRLRQPRTRVDARVISFGNISAGGTGKTPAVIERAAKEIAAGRKVAVLTRGFGARRHARPLIHVPGTDPASRPFLGDEPELIACRIPEVVIVRTPDRVTAAQLAIREHACDTLILDDGFQYVRLERDENIAVIDASNPFGNGRLLPRGILREPIEALARATHILLTHCDHATDLAALTEQLRALCPDAPIRQTRHAPTGLWRLTDAAPMDLDFLKGAQVAAVCAIGHPEAFFRTLEEAGAHLSARIAYPDHTEFPLESLPHADLIATTEKDAVRMKNPPPNMAALRIDLQDIAPAPRSGS